MEGSLIALTLTLGLAMVAHKPKRPMWAQSLKHMVVGMATDASGGWHGAPRTPSPRRDRHCLDFNLQVGTGRAASEAADMAGNFAQTFALQPVDQGLLVHGGIVHDFTWWAKSFRTTKGIATASTSTSKLAMVTWRC